MAANFSGAVRLTDLDDFITPSQACVKPVKIEKSSSRGLGKIRIGDDGGYFEIHQDGRQEKLAKASVTLNDCLACSGCITSAESVLISQQSHQQLYSVLDDNKRASIGDRKTVVVSIAPQARASLATKYQLNLTTANDKLISFFKMLGVDHVVDSTFARNFSLIESQREFVARYKANNVTNKWPLLAGICPGWVCYAEKSQGELLVPLMSSTKSPQQVMGSLIKSHLAETMGVSAADLYHVSVEACFDKKLEASRDDFASEGIRDVDCVITPVEVQQMLEKENLDLAEVESISSNDLFSTRLKRHSGSGSGGFAEHVFKYACKELFQATVDEVHFQPQRNPDLLEAKFEQDGQVKLHFAIVNGFRNIQNLAQKIKRKKCPYHYVEVMACPSGCVNGGGQLKAGNVVEQRELLERVEGVYREAEVVDPHTQVKVNELYRLWLGEQHPPMLHTQYHAVEKSKNALMIKW